MTVTTVSMEAELEGRLRFIGLTKEHKPVAAKVWEIIEPKLDAVLEIFYQNVSGTPVMKDILGAQATRLKGEQHKHWRVLFSMELGADYIERCIRVGNVHARIGLDPSMFSAAYGTVMVELEGHIMDAFKFKPALRKQAMLVMTRLLFLDMSFSIGTYYTAMMRVQSEQFSQTEHTATEVARAAQEAANAITQISDGAQVQIQVIRDVSQALSETRESTQQIVTVVQSAATQSSENADAVAVSQTRMRELGSMMDQIKTNSAKIGKLAEYAERIAEQTTLLAVNAAIQASKASSLEGAGFSVVAAEVGKLADQSNTSVQDINEIVKEAQRVADQGIVVANALEQEIGMLGERSRGIRDLMVNVSTGMNEQQRSVGTVSDSMDSLQEIGMASTTAAEEIAATMVTLSRMASGTLRDVQDMRQRNGAKAK